jgi:hypothetical protein
MDNNFTNINKISNHISPQTYIFVVVENPIVNRGKIGIPLTGSTLPHVTACPKP